jgi:hypothetical protein
MARRLTLFVGGQPFGPIDEEYAAHLVRTSAVRPETPCWPEGAAAWTTLGAELPMLFAGAPAAPWPAPPAPRPRLSRGRKVAIAVTVAVGVLGQAAFAVWLLQRDTGTGVESGSGGGAVDGAGTTTAVAGTATMPVTPDEGGAVEVGPVRVWLEPQSVARPATVGVSVAADGAIGLTMEPPQVLARPAGVIVPMPPGAKLGDDPQRWPVVLLLSEDAEPLVLALDGIAPGGLAVSVPHFSTVIPTTVDDARRRLADLGRNLADAVGQFAPGNLSVNVQLPETSSTSNWTSAVNLQVVALTGGPQPRGPELEGGRLKPEWFAFDGLKVVVECQWVQPDGREEVQRLGEFPLANGAAKVTVDAGSVPSSAGDAPFRVFLVHLTTADGRMITTRSVSAPAGAYWGVHTCKRRDGTTAADISYLRDPANSQYADHGYSSSTQPARQDGEAVPAMAIDLCTAFNDSFDKLSAIFGKPPALPMKVVLQPWRESQARWAWVGRNAIEIQSRGCGDYDELKTAVAHETAHQFQFMQSSAYFGAGQWFHETSAEYYAHHIWDPGPGDAEVGKFASRRQADAGWIGHGLQSPSDLDNYPASSFLAYLAHARGVTIFLIWSGSSRTEGWVAAIDRAGLGGSGDGSAVGEAWGAFARAYLIDHSLWAGSVGWDSVDVDSALRASGGGLILLSPKSGSATRAVTLHAADRHVEAPALSAGGQTVRWRPSAGESATIVVRLHARNGRGWLGRLPGTEADGRPGIEMSAISSAGTVVGDDVVDVFALGAKQARPASFPPDYDDTAVRYVWWYTDVSAGSGALGFEAWAIPELLDVKLEPASSGQQPGTAGQGPAMRLTWTPSPLEQEPELFGGYEIVLRDRSGTETIVGREGAGVAQFLVEPPPGITLDAACVRVRDGENHLGPLACNEQHAAWSFERVLTTDLCIGRCNGLYRASWTPAAEPGIVVGTITYPPSARSITESYTFSWDLPPPALAAGESVALRFGIRLTKDLSQEDPWITCAVVRAGGDWEGKAGKPHAADFRVEIVGGTGSADECRNCTLHSDYCSPDVSGVATVVVPRVYAGQQGAPPTFEILLTTDLWGGWIHQYRFIYRGAALPGP